MQSNSTVIVIVIYSQTRKFQPDLLKKNFHDHDLLFGLFKASYEYSLQSEVDSKYTVHNENWK